MTEAHVLYSYLVIERSASMGHQTGWGQKFFKVPPRVGEIITAQHDGAEHGFEVVVVLHGEHTAQHVGELIVERRGKMIDIRKDWNRGGER